MKRRILSVILTLCLMAGLSPPGAWAAQAETDAQSGTCGDNLTWTLASGVLTISGTGPMTDYQAYLDSVNSPTTPNMPWYDNRQNITALVIENGVTTIGKCAFYECNALESATIPNGLTSIGESAFYECRALANVTIPNSVTTIGNYAFARCDAVTSLTIPNSVTTIGESAFFVSGLRSVTIPDSVTAIATRTFRACNYLESVTIPTSVTSIGNGAFNSCGALTDVYYGGTETQWNAVTIDDTDNANAALHSATIHFAGESDAVSECHVFFEANGGSGEMPEVTLTPDSSGALRYVLPQCALTPPQNMTFRAWSVTRYDADSSTTVTEGQPGDELDLTGVVSLGLTPLWETAVDDNILASGYCGGAGDGMNLSWVLTNDGVLTIAGSGPMANYGSGSSPWHNYRQNIQSIVMERGVTSVGSCAFYGCSAAASVTIPDGVTAIGYHAFEGCSGLTGLTIPDGVTSISDGAFMFYGATSVTIPVSVASIGYRAFYASNALTDVYYGGTRAQWATLQSNIGTDNNLLLSATIHCTDGDIVNGATTYAVTFAPNGGSGVMQPVNVTAGATYALPQCGFDAPRNMRFRAWSVNGAEYAPGAIIAISADTVVTALWETDPSLDPYRVLDAIHDMDTFEDQTWHLAGPLSEFRNLFFDRDPDEPSSDTPLTPNADYAAEEGSTKLNIPAGTFARFGEGTHSVEADFQTSPDPNAPGDDGTRTAAGYYTVRPSGSVTIDASEIDAAKAVKDVSLTARFRTVPRLNDAYYRFVVTDGEIPAGLTFHEGGYFTGVARNEQTYSFTLGLQVRKYDTDPWPDAYSDTLQVTIAVEPNTAQNVETSSDPGYELVERIPATVEEGGGTLHLVSKGPFEEFQDFYIDGVKQTRGVDYQVRPCEIDPATGRMIRLLDGGAVTGTYLSMLASKLSAGAHDLNLEYLGKDNIGNPKPRNASQKVTVTKRTTPVVTPVSSGGGSSRSSSGGSSSPASYSIKTGSASNGKISLSAKSIAAGKTVTITVTPNSGYQTGSVSVIDSRKNSVTVKRDGNQYTFTMPSRTVTVSATFTPVSYGVSAASAQHGKITLDKSSATRGATVNGTTTPDKGYLLSGVTVRDASGASVKTETFDNGKFTFLMPLGGVTVSATFTVKRLASFVDIQGPDWFFDDAEWAYNRGLLQGVTAQYWEPQSLMSSVTSIVTLERMDGVDLTPYDTGADDGLDNSLWYVSAWRWARDNDILLKDRPFGEREAMTRGEFAVMLANYLRYRGMSVTPTNDVVFGDAAEMTEDELTAFRFLQDADVFRGYSDGTIRPNAYLSRAHLSALLHRLSAYIIKAETDGV